MREFKKAFASNPLLPISEFIPDVEARTWADGRLYLYGSYDIGGDQDYCSHVHHVYSTEDFIHWEDYGELFSSAPGTGDVPWSQARLYAPDCIEKNGKYYLYFCLSDGSEGVAEADSPKERFHSAQKMDGTQGIDPGVFIDDDGQAYIYWGQFDRVRAAKLMEDMRTIDTSSVIQPLDVENFNFHEGSSMRKHNGIYYYVYADTGRHGDRPTCLGYATSDSPMGPFTYRGVIIDNYGCDPEVWNNHGSIAEYKGQWYVFYHRSSRNGIYSRRVCAEPIHFNEDGSITEVEMTSQGCGGPIAATNRLDAWLACLLNGTVYLTDCEAGGEQLCGMSDGDWAAFKYIDFGEGVDEFTVCARTETKGEIEIRMDRPAGPLLVTCRVEREQDPASKAGFGSYSCMVTETCGVHALYLVFRGDLEVNYFNFK